MAQILSFAQAFGARSEAEPSEEAQPTQGTAPPLMDEGMLFGILQMVQQLQQRDSKQEALLCALKPYLAPKRREKLDQAMQIARLSSLAGLALKNSGGLFGSKEG